MPKNIHNNRRKDPNLNRTQDRNTAQVYTGITQQPITLTYLHWGPQKTKTQKHKNKWTNLLSFIDESKDMHNGKQSKKTHKNNKLITKLLIYLNQYNKNWFSLFFINTSSNILRKS